MDNYFAFMNKYFKQFKSELDYNGYYSLKEYIETIILDSCDFNGYKIDDISAYVDFTMVYLLHKYDCKYIFKNGLEEEIEEVFGRAYKKNTAKKEDSKGLTYVIKAMKVISKIFDSSVDITELAQKVYNSLKFDGFSDDQICEHKCDNNLLSYLCDGYFDVKYNENFSSLRREVANGTSAIFAREKIAIIRQNPDETIKSIAYSYYDNPTYQRQVAFKSAINFYLLNYPSLEFDKVELAAYVYDYVEKDIIRTNSSYNRTIKENRKNKPVRTKMEKENEAESNKRKAIVLGVIAGIFVIDNLFYNLINDNKEEKNNQPEHHVSESISKPNKKNSSINYNYEKNEILVEGEHYGR